MHDSFINFHRYNCGEFFSCTLNSFSVVLRIVLVQRSLEAWVWLKDSQMANISLTDRCLRFVALKLLLKTGGAQNTMPLRKRECQEWVANNCPCMEIHRAWWLLYSWRPKSITWAMINVNCFVFILLGEHLGLSLELRIIYTSYLTIGLHQTLFCVKPDNRWFLLRLAFTAGLPLVIPLGPACTRKQLFVFLNLSWLLSGDVAYSLS